MKMTVELLEELGTCGEYTRTFRRLFPIDQYPDGVDITEAVCREHAADFTWNWAVENLLGTSAGYDAYHAKLGELQRELSEVNSRHNEAKAAWRTEYQQRYNEPDWDTPQEAKSAYNELTEKQQAELQELGLYGSQIEARAFGHVFETMPDARRRGLDRLQERAVERVEQAIINEYERAEYQVTATKRDIEAAQATIARLTEKLPELEAAEAALRLKVIPAKARRAEAHAKLMAQRAEEAAKSAETAQQVAAEAQAKAEELKVEAETTKTTTDGSGSAATEAEQTAAAS